MCVSPRFEPFTGGLVACRHCWACRKARVDDYVGRGLAERETAAGVSVLTLTYAGDVPGAVLLLHYDVRKFFMRLRKAGYPLRYILAGEHGSRHNRAHWHVIIYWQGSVPSELPPLGEFAHWRFWPHGHVHSMVFSVSSLRYTIKYLLKDQDLETSVSRFSLSKRPLIGLPFFFSQADAMIEKRALPRDLFYTFADVLDRHGKPYRFHLRGRAAERFLDRFEIGWRLRWGEPPPLSQYLIDRYHVPIGRKESRDGLVPHFVPGPQVSVENSYDSEPDNLAGRAVSGLSAAVGYADVGDTGSLVAAYNRAGRQRVAAEREAQARRLVHPLRDRGSAQASCPDAHGDQGDSRDSRSRAYWRQVSEDRGDGVADLGDT